MGSGNPNANATPFGTNAAGKVANLNADRVDDLHADEIIARAKDQWAVVGSDGALTRKNGATAASKLGAGDYEVVFGGQRGLVRLQRDARHGRHGRRRPRARWASPSAPATPTRCAW